MACSTPAPAAARATHVIGQAGAIDAAQSCARARRAGRGAPGRRTRRRAFRRRRRPRSTASRSTWRTLAARPRPAASRCALRGIYEGQVPQVVSFVAQAAEVEVDPETGQVHVRRVASAHDVGTILNPLGHQGQIDGGVVMGVGSALMEGSDLEKGASWPPTWATTSCPRMADIPGADHRPRRGARRPCPLRRQVDRRGAVRPGAAAIANAVRDATGVPIYHSRSARRRPARAAGEEPMSQAATLPPPTTVVGAHGRPSWLHTAKAEIARGGYGPTDTPRRSTTPSRSRSSTRPAPASTSSPTARCAARASLGSFARRIANSASRRRSQGRRGRPGHGAALETTRPVEVPPRPGHRRGVRVPEATRRRPIKVTCPGPVTRSPPTSAPWRATAVAAS